MNMTIVDQITHSEKTELVATLMIVRACIATVFPGHQELLSDNGQYYTACPYAITARSARRCAAYSSPM